MVEEIFVVPTGAPGLAMICGALLGLGFSRNKPAGERMVKSGAAVIAEELGFGGVRLVARVDHGGAATLEFSASTPSQLGAVMRLLQEHAVPGTGRPISSLLKGMPEAAREAAEQRARAQEVARLKAEAPARQAAARAAARQEAAWRCRVSDLATIESRLVAIGAQRVPGDDGLPVLKINGEDTTIQLRQDASGPFGEVRLVGFRRPDFSTAARAILGGAELLSPIDPRTVEARPVKKSWADVARRLPASRKGVR